MSDCSTVNGWPYWGKPSNASKSLQEIIRKATLQQYRRDSDYVAPTAADVRKAYRPIKAFLTRFNNPGDDRPEIIEP